MGGQVLGAVLQVIPGGSGRPTTLGFRWRSPTIRHTDLISLKTEENIIWEDNTPPENNLD